MSDKRARETETGSLGTGKPSFTDEALHLSDGSDIDSDVCSEFDSDSIDLPLLLGMPLVLDLPMTETMFMTSEEFSVCKYGL